VWSLAAAVIAGQAASFQLDARIVAISIVGMAIHFLGAGGISMPGVSQSLWAMLALGLNVSEGSREPYSHEGSKVTRTAMFCVLAGWMCFVLWGLRPVTASVSSVALGRRLFADRDRAGAEVQFRLAAAHDPLWFEPWLELSRIHYERWLASRGRASEDQFDHATAALAEAQRLAPSRLEPVRLLAGLYEARAGDSPVFWANAAEAYRRCVEMYPTSASLHARWAHALSQSGQQEAARDVARRASQLDAQTPHLDRKLSEPDRKLIEALQAPPAPVE
jgi:tetratricopeptide (TPR) repeat protein